MVGHLNLISMRKIVPERLLLVFLITSMKRAKFVLNVGNHTKMPHKKVQHPNITRVLELLHMNFMGLCKLKAYEIWSMSLFGLMISQGTCGLNSFVKSLILSLSLKVCVDICVVRMEKKLVRLLVFAMIMEENLRTQICVLLKVWFMSFRPNHTSTKWSFRA